MWLRAAELNWTFYKHLRTSLLNESIPLIVYSQKIGFLYEHSLAKQADLNAISTVHALLPVVGPESHVGVNDLALPFAGHAPPLQHGRVEPVSPQDLDPVLQGQVMELVGHLKCQMCKYIIDERLIQL